MAIAGEGDPKTVAALDGTRRMRTLMSALKEKTSAGCDMSLGGGFRFDPKFAKSGLSDLRTSTKSDKLNTK